MNRSAPSQAAQLFYPALLNYLHSAIAEFSLISNERIAELEKIAQYIRTCFDKSQTARLIFICTHNSRRSHLSQIWAQIAADYYALDNIETYSGGTEATAFNPRAVAALQRCGLQLKADDPQSTNPKYEVRASESFEPQICFSKVYDAAPNPIQGYCAVMTCSQADDACPLVMGCDLRAALRYEDPKVADDTDQEAAKYDERSKQICREMLYMMSQV